MTTPFKDLKHKATPEQIEHARGEPEIVNSRAEEDPIIIEAILNIQMAIQHIAPIWEATHSEDLAQAQADLEQALRFLKGEEEPD